MGMVAPSAHHMGSITSATSPNIVKVIQKILRSTVLKSSEARTCTRRANTIRPYELDFFADRLAVDRLRDPPEW